MAGREGLYVHIVQPGENLTTIVKKNFQVQSNAEIGQKVSEVARLSYVKDVDTIRAGQLLVLGDDAQRLPMSRMAEPILEKEDLFRLQNNVNALTPTERRVLGTHWDILQGGLDLVRQQLYNAPSTIVAIGERYGVGPTNDVVGGASGGVSSMAKKVWEQPKQPARHAFGHAIEAEINGLKQKATSAARSIRETARTAVRRGPISTKPTFSVRVSPTILSSRAIVAQMDLMQTLLKGTRHVSRASTALNVGVSICKIANAKPEDRPKVTASEVGSIVGGSAFGAGAAYLVCNLAFGLPTGGTSVIWCGLVAGGVGGYVGARVGTRGGEALYEEGVSAYNKITSIAAAAREFNYLTLPPVAW